MAMPRLNGRLGVAKLRVKGPPCGEVVLVIGAVHITASERSEKIVVQYVCSFLGIVADIRALTVPDTVLPYPEAPRSAREMSERPVLTAWRNPGD